jgi:hypothetical protein
MVPVVVVRRMLRVQFSFRPEKQISQHLRKTLDYGQVMGQFFPFPHIL